MNVKMYQWIPSLSYPYHHHHHYDNDNENNKENNDADNDDNDGDNGDNDSTNKDGDFANFVVEANEVKGSIIRVIAWREDHARYTVYLRPIKLRSPFSSSSSFSSLIPMSSSSSTAIKKEGV